MPHDEGVCVCVCGYALSQDMEDMVTIYVGLQFLVSGHIWFTRFRFGSDAKSSVESWSPSHSQFDRHLG